MNVKVESGTESLVVSRATAYKQIAALIAEGRVLLALRIQSDEALRSAEKREQEWVALAIGFFNRMFDSDLYARQYLKFQSRVFGPLSFEQRLSYFEHRVQECLDQLESDFRRLPVISESELISKHSGIYQIKEVKRHTPALPSNKWIFVLGSAGIALLIFLQNPDLQTVSVERRVPAFLFASLSSALAFFGFSFLRLKKKRMQSVRWASSTGVFALAFLLDPVGRWLPPSSQLAQYYIAEDLDSIGGTGWIFVGNYDMSRYNWTTGPFVQIEKPSGNSDRHFPWVGDIIKLKTPRRLVLPGWETNRRLDFPTEKTKVLESDFTPLQLPSETILKVADIQWSPSAGDSVMVWARVAAP